MNAKVLDKYRGLSCLCEGDVTQHRQHHFALTAPGPRVSNLGVQQSPGAPVPTDHGAHS